MYDALMHPKSAAGMANNVDPDQTALYLALPCAYSDLSVPILRIFMVTAI